MNRIGFYVVGALIVLMVAFSTLFIVDQRQFAVIYALGEIKEVVTEPGLKFKLPPPLQNVVFIDRRTQTLDSPETRPIFTAEKKSLVIDWLVKWRVTDARQFIRNNGVDMRNVESRLSPIVQAAFNEEVTKRTVQAMLATDRDRVMQGVRVRLGDEAKSFGIEIVDVRIKRVDFSSNITDSVIRSCNSAATACKRASLKAGLPSSPALSARRYCVTRSTRLIAKPQLWAMSVALEAQGDTVPRRGDTTIKGPESSPR